MMEAVEVDVPKSMPMIFPNFVIEEKWKCEWRGFLVIVISILVGFIKISLL
jgi:hypothetical protein